jgi:D-serine deaminase-like pyridoxal phosphate-dependent protein
VRHRLPPVVAERLRALSERPIEPAEKGFGSLGARHGRGPGTPGDAGRVSATGLAAGTPGSAGRVSAAGLAAAGTPAGAGRVTAAGLAAARPPLHAAGFTYPLLTLRDTALQHNVAAMAAYCARTGVALAPHGKTAMSPELAALQLAHGAWGITVASIGQLQVYRAFGFPRLLLANELVDEAGLAWLAGELAADPGFEAYCYVDSLDGVQILDRALARHRAGRALPVLVEIGPAEGGRTGCRTDQQALEVAKAADATGTLAVAGVAGWEGTLHGETQADTLELVAAFCRRLRGFADAVAASTGAASTGAGATGAGATGGGATRGGATGGGAGRDGLIVTAGGSASFDVVARELTAPGAARVMPILRSGCYLTHDHGLYARVSPGARGAAGAPAFQPALELWAQVLSRPEPGLALLGAGRRDVGFDAGWPVPLRVVRRDGRPAAAGGWEVSGLNDQHAFLRLPGDAALAPGDLVALGVSHPCTTLDKWRVLVIVNDDDRVIDAVHSFF